MKRDYLKLCEEVRSAYNQINCELAQKLQSLSKEELQARTCYYQDYNESSDMTIIFKEIQLSQDEVLTTVSGFYYGEPNDKGFEDFKEKNWMIL